uniref:Uncharacterized protein n=1 Tax=Rhizophora mucronata TaxID=61149 RepID=A0A2P2PTZ6_RHIMU
MILGCHYLAPNRRPKYHGETQDMIANSPPLTFSIPTDERINLVCWVSEFSALGVVTFTHRK